MKEKIQYGHITETDGDAFEYVVVCLPLSTGKVLRYLEIGPFGGGTTAGVRKLCENFGIEIDCWGIDVVERAPRELYGAGQYIIAPSEEAWMQIPPLVEFDIIFVDGCHCINHVALDSLHYGSRVKLGGFMLFHDAAPAVQGVQTNDWVHKEDKPIHRTAVREAIALAGWPNREWKFIREFCDVTKDYGGIVIYQKVA